ncbi:MAG: ChaN family lipoprotein [Pseudomonadota bacterium]
MKIVSASIVLILLSTVLITGCYSMKTTDVDVFTPLQETEPSSVAEIKLPEKLPVRFDATKHTDNPLVGHFWSVPEEKIVPWMQVMKTLPQGGWLILGELHDHSDHQKMEAIFINILARTGILGNVAMEQLRPDQQPLLNDWYGKGNFVTGTDLNWKPQAWDWNSYIMPLSYALNHSPKVLALDLSHQSIGEIYADKRVVQKSTQEHETLLAELINASHCQTERNRHTDAMVKVQLAKDQFMAQQLIDNTLVDKINVMIAGLHHSRKDFGVPLWLEKNAKTNKTVTIAFLPVTNSHDGKSYLPSRYQERLAADYIFFTPAKNQQQWECPQSELVTQHVAKHQK